MDPRQVVRDDTGMMRCRECGFTYALSPRDIGDRARSEYDAVAAAVASVPDTYRGRRPSPGVWSVNAYTAHLADAAEVITYRINAIAGGDRPSLPNHDQDAAVEESCADERPAEESLARLEQTVEAFRRSVEGLPDDAWDRVGIHSVVGEVRLREVAHDMPHELQHHAEDIRRVGRDVQSQASAGQN